MPYSTITHVDHPGEGMTDKVSRLQLRAHPQALLGVFNHPQMDHTPAHTTDKHSHPVSELTVVPAAAAKGQHSGGSTFPDTLC